MAGFQSHRAPPHVAGLVLARGGSEAIPLKNLAKLDEGCTEASEEGERRGEREGAATRGLSQFKVGYPEGPERLHE